MTPVLPARSHGEVVEYVALQQCPCGSARPFAVDRPDPAECRLEFACPQCGARDGYRYELTGPEAGRPSQLIGPGGWAQAAAQHAMVLLEEYDFQQVVMEPTLTVEQALRL